MEQQPIRRDRNGKFVSVVSKHPHATGKDLPKSAFWHCSREGLRSREPGVAIFAAPKAHSLILELAARGWVICCTGLSYMEEIVPLRDTFLSGLPIRLLQVSFNWKPSFDPIKVILKQHKTARARLGKSGYTLSGKAETQLRDHHSRRLSTISAYILGGKLNPSFQLLEY